MTHAPRITASLAREIAVAASADPRTVVRVLRGGDAKGMVDTRIRAAIAARGIAPIHISTNHSGDHVA